MSNIINPQSEVKLLNVNITSDNKNQYSFASLQEQTNFFLSKAIGKNFNNCTFVRDGEITVEGHIYEVFNANYMMFKNTGFSDKWFYAFITKIEYVSQNSSKIYYELDPFQTWYFNITYHNSFIVREHVTNDSIGANTVDEGIGYGDYVFWEAPVMLENLNNYLFVIGVTQQAPESDTDNTYVAGGIYEHLYSGLKYYVTGSGDVLNHWLLKYISHGKPDAVVYIQCVPKFCIPYFDAQAEQASIQADAPLDLKQFVQGQHGSMGGHGARSVRTYQFSQSAIDGYYPKNNKLFCYPYNVIELTNNRGQTAIYKPELFNNFGNASFELLANFTGNITVLCVPSYYGKMEQDLDENYFYGDEGITINDFPMCAWNNDAYLNWLAQNSYGNNIQLGIGVAGGILGTGIGLATGNPIAVAGGIGSLASSVGNYLTNERKAEVTPNQARGNTGSGNVLSSQGLLGFYINHKCIKYEFAKIIDDYFTMFGYKVNKLGTPALRSRTNWNYIETKNVNITGNIPQEHLQIIKNMFDNGVTLWHNDNVGNYNRNNPVR